MNETPITGGEFPGRKERRLKMAEAIEVMKLLWSEERVDFEGEYYKLRRATIYDRPDEPVPIYVAASGPLAAKLAGRVGDGFICTRGKDPQLYVDLLDNVREGAEKAGRDYESIKRMIEIKVSYDRDREVADDGLRTGGRRWRSRPRRRKASRTRWRWSASPTTRSTARTPASSSPTTRRRSSDKIQPYIDLGFHELVFHFPGDDQKRYIDEFAADVFPLLRA